jgi:threonine synthase
MSIWQYASDLGPLAELTAANRVSLGEGNTPLIRSRRIGPDAGLRDLYFKLESSNPTGSYKDRFAAAAVTDMLAGGKRNCVATSSGNTGAAVAAYCAAAAIPCSIAIVDGAPVGKVRQMQAYGARLYTLRGFGTDAAVSSAIMEKLLELAQGDAALQISAFRFSPMGMTGVQSLAYELADQRPEGWNHVFCPSGGGGLTLAVARGFARLVDSDRMEQSPAVECVQPAGNDTMSGPLRRGESCGQSVQSTTTISGLQVALVIDADQTIAACAASGGTGHLVADDQVYEVQRRLALEEGVFCEPVGAVGLAGALQARRDNLVHPDSAIVCLITGTGFKDPQSVERMTAAADVPCLGSAADIEPFLNSLR